MKVCMSASKCDELSIFILLSIKTLNFECRTRCEEEPEEETIIREIQSMFPNDVTDDFGEFVQEATLEQIKTNKPTTSGVKVESPFLSGEDFKMICNTFILLMNKFSRYFVVFPIFKIMVM